MMTTREHLMFLETPENGQARVALWRWQHGTLPAPEDTRELDIPSALRTAARGELPAPEEMRNVLEYVADTLEDKLPDAKLYITLLHAVETKYPGETRYDTALRYIREREMRCDNNTKES